MGSPPAASSPAAAAEAPTAKQDDPTADDLSPLADIVALPRRDAEDPARPARRRRDR
jgi:hypothetical protein